MNHLERLSRYPGKYHIFHALRIIDAKNSGNSELGNTRRPADDSIRLRQVAELSFPPSTISEFVPPNGDAPGHLKNRFFGFFGPHGPLPNHVTEYARERYRVHRDPTLIAFADMLTHRMMSLLYRAWATGQFAPSLDRKKGGLADDKVAALSGHLGKHLRDRDAMPDFAKRHFAGHLGRCAKNADGLVAILSAFFSAPVSLQQFVGSWLELESDDRWVLGETGTLGKDTSIGTRVWSRAAKFRLRIGPMGLDDYLKLLPGEPALERLKAIVRNYVGQTLDWDINLVLKGDEIPPAILGRETRLGHTSWIGAPPTRKAADDLYLAP